MRAFAAAAAVLALMAPAAAGSIPRHVRVAFMVESRLVVLDTVTGSQRVALTHAHPAPLGWSGDGQLLSVGGHIVGGPSLPAGSLAWAPTGETAAYQSKLRGAVMLWTPHGTRMVVPASWDASSFAWGPGGRLALARYACNAPCGVPRHQEVWIWRNGSLRRIVSPLKGIDLPIVDGFTPDGRVLWWADPQGSGSIAADGLPLYANTTRVGDTLVWPDYVARCGMQLAIAAGGDRFATHRKRILVDGRDVSRNAALSWVSPVCSADGKTLVAAAGRNWQESRIGSGEQRSIWQLLPTRRRLTHAPPGWTDENPRVLGDGSILFIRTRQTSFRRYGTWWSTTSGRLELIAHGRVARLATTRVTVAGTDPLTVNYYGHYAWPSLVAVTP